MLKRTHVVIEIESAELIKNKGKKWTHLVGVRSSTQKSGIVSQHNNKFWSLLDPIGYYFFTFFAQRAKIWKKCNVVRELCIFVFDSNATLGLFGVTPFLRIFLKSWHFSLRDNRASTHTPYLVIFHFLPHSSADSAIDIFKVERASIY